MEVIPTNLPGVIRINTQVYTDDRGSFTEAFQQQRYADAGIDAPFVQANLVHSTRTVLRGMHYQLQQPQGKLISVTQGEIFDVAVDMRAASPHFGKWTGAILRASAGEQMYIPPGFAHGYCVLTDTADVMYQCTGYYHPASEQTLAWNDPQVGIKWPVTAPLLSDKDARGLNLDLAPGYTDEILV